MRPHHARDMLTRTSENTLRVRSLVEILWHKLPEFADDGHQSADLSSIGGGGATQSVVERMALTKDDAKAALQRAKTLIVTIEALSAELDNLAKDWTAGVRQADRYRLLHCPRCGQCKGERSKLCRECADVDKRKARR